MKTILLIIAMFLVASCNTTTSPITAIDSGNYITKDSNCPGMPASISIKPEYIQLDLSATYGACAQDSKLYYDQTDVRTSNFTSLVLTNCATHTYTAEEAGFTYMQSQGSTRVEVRMTSCLVTYGQ
jgi:hypothetical protein